MNKIKIAAIQLCSNENISANLSECGRLIDDAAKVGAQYILTPEMTPFFPANARDIFVKEYISRIDEIQAFFAHKAIEHQLYIHLGSMAVPNADGRAANRSFLYQPSGETAASYDKIHLFDADIDGDRAYRESDDYVAGDKAVIAKTPLMNVGMSICYDVRFPQLYQSLALNDAHLLSVPAAFTVPTGRAHWQILLSARAIETGCFVIAAAQTGVRGHRATFGHSMIIDQWGQVLDRLDDEVGFVHAEIELGSVKNFRKKIANLANSAKFSLSINHVVSD